MQLYSTLVLPVIKESLQNFIDTEIYLCRFNIDYKVNEEEYNKAECLWLWYQHELTNWEKIVKIERIWQISNIWFVDVDIEKQWNLILNNFQYLRWTPTKEELFKKNLEQAIKTQYNIFHKDECIEKTWKWVFIEVKKTNFYKSYIYYIKKTNHLIPLNFDNNWNLIDLNNVKLFKINNEILYDINEWLFIKNDEKIWLWSWDLNNQKFLFLKYLISNLPAYSKQDDMINYIWIKWDGARDDKKKFHDLKDRIVKDIFIKKLWIPQEKAKNIIESKSWLVKINWNFI